MDKILRNIDPELWREIKAQAALEDKTLTEWIEEAASKQLGKNLKTRDSYLKKRLPSKADCVDCGREVIKGGKGERRMIMHHDDFYNHNPTVAVILCPSCHKIRHEKARGRVYQETLDRQKEMRKRFK